MGTWKDNWNTKDKAINSSVKTLGALSNIGLSAYNMATPNTEDMLDAVNNEIQSRNTLGFNAKSFDDLMSQWSAYKPLETSFNKDDYYVGPSTGDILKNTLSSTLSGATTGVSVGGPWGALIGGVVGLGSGLIGGFTGKSKAEEAAEEAVRKKEQEARNVNAFQQASLNLNANNLKTQQRNMLDAQYAAFGGSLGGYGTDWSNGLTFIDNGGTHGQNPLGGVPMGMDKEGIPNLVEEGEVIWNDYVFSNRLKVPNAIRSKYKLKENLTFAQAVTKIQKASAERPNDPIEKRGLEDMLNDLMQEQEMIRQKKAEREQKKQDIALRNLHALGGRLFEDGGDKDIPPALLEKLKIAVEGTRMSPESFYKFLVNRVGMTPEQIAYLSSKSTVNISERLIKGVFQASKKNELIDAMYGEGTVDQLNNIKWLYDNLKNAEQYKTNIQEAKSLYYEALNALPDYISDIIDSSFATNDSRFESGWVKDYQDRYSFDDEGNPYFTFTEQPNKPKSTIEEEYIPINNAKGNIDESSTLPTINEIPRVDISGINNHNINNDFYRAALKNIPSIPPKDRGIPEPKSDIYRAQLSELPQSDARTTPEEEPEDNDNTFKFNPVLLRYAPILGSVIGVGTNLFNRPDYKYANELDKAAQTAANSIPKVSATALGDYMTYNPFDRMFYANELGAQAAANRRAIQNMSNGNRATAVANLLAADYNNNIGLGKLYRQGEEYNLAQRQAVSEFNRATNQYNAEADLKAQMANAELDQAKANMLLNSKMKSLGMRQADDNLWDANMAANLTNLFDNIGNIGWEEFNKNMINSNKGLKYYLDWLGNTQYKSGKNGGYLTIKYRRKK